MGVQSAQKGDSQLRQTLLPASPLPPPRRSLDSAKPSKPYAFLRVFTYPSISSVWNMLVLELLLQTRVR